MKKEHDYLICIDSDGCAMDTMNSKHFYCFGPEWVKQYGLEDIQSLQRTCHGIRMGKRKRL